MNREQIMTAIHSLAQSQGFYSRIYSALCDARDNSPEEFDACMSNLESKNFKDAVDLVLYLET